MQSIGRQHESEMIEHLFGQRRRRNWFAEIALLVALVVVGPLIAYYAYVGFTGDNDGYASCSKYEYASPAYTQCMLDRDAQRDLARP